MLRAPRNACGVLLTACLLAAVCGSAFGGDCQLSAGMSSEGTKALSLAASPQLVAAELRIMKTLAPRFCNGFGYKQSLSKAQKLNYFRKGSRCVKTIKENYAYTSRMSKVGGAEVKRSLTLKSYLGIKEYTQAADHLANMDDLCNHLLTELSHHHPICETAYTIEGSHPVHGTINCQRPPRTGYVEKTYKSSDLTAVLDICTTPCMADKTTVCCKVPLLIADRFQCCRSQGCCPDERRRRLASTQGVTAPRKAQVSVAVAVTVEDSTSASSVYDALLRCLQNPAKLDAMCLTGSAGH